MNLFSKNYLKGLDTPMKIRHDFASSQQPAASSQQPAASSQQPAASSRAVTLLILV